MRATKETHVQTRQQPKPARKNSHHRKVHENRHQTSRKITAAKGTDYYQLVARATNDAVRDWDLTSHALSWPQGLDSLLGYAPDAAGQTIAFWQEQIHRDDCARIAASIRKAIKSRADHWSGEYRFRHAKGYYVPLLERASIAHDKNGRAVRFVGSLMDVSARKQLQDQFSHAQKMEAFGQLAGGVAHDFNNFLTAILGYSDLLVAEVESRSRGAKYLSEIRSAAGRAASLTKQLLTFSRREPLEPRVLEVNKFIHNLERSILRLLGENISVLCELIPEKKYIKVDPDQFTQIIINLAVNARDAMPEGGTLLVKTEMFSANGNAPEMPPGKYVGISIIDNGMGMSDDAKEHLFEPFFTTKDDRHASGLGLATCYGIVRQSGGHITVESQLAKGTAIHIYLPEVAAPPGVTYRKRPKMPIGSETILVVEDDISVRHVTVRTLRMLGYNVLEAFRADEAKRLIKNNPINLVVSDIVLPDMSGCDFADWMRTHCPATQVLLTSGYLPETTIGSPSTDLPFLSKPFDVQQLAETVRASLDAVVVS